MSDSKEFSLIDLILLPYKVSEKVARWYEANKSAIDAFAGAVVDAAEGLTIIDIESRRMFAKSGWSEIPLRNMDAVKISQTVEGLMNKSDDEVQRTIDDRVLEYFRDNNCSELRELVEEWEDHFAGRLHILEDALWAHAQGKYTLSVPTLATQIEGIIRDLTGDKEEGNNWQKVFREGCEGISQPFGNKRNEPSPSVITEEIVEQLREYTKLSREMRFRRLPEFQKLGDSVKMLRLRSLFEPKNFGAPGTSSVINRHVIAHGIFTEFGEKESLKLFFALDLLHEAVGIYKENLLEN